MITIVGLGFVGLTTGLGFAKKGMKTFGFDINEDRVRTLKNLDIPFHEPHLKEVITDTYNKTFILDSDFSEAIEQSEAIFICVGTPGRENGSADLTYVFNAINQIVEINTQKFQVIVIKSTVPPSTLSKKVLPFVTEKMNETQGRRIGLASNPEFLREGHCWEDFYYPDRVVIGAEDPDSKEILNKIYFPFEAPIHFVSYTTAEYIKYLSNTLLSTLVSFANEMSMVAHHIGDIEIAKAFNILHEDRRWKGSPAPMSTYVFPGCGYGGYCLPKDTSAMASISEEHGYEPKMLKSNIHVNSNIKEMLVDSIERQISPSDTLGILGLSFKPDSDDVRFSSSKNVIELLINKGYRKILAYDPVANKEFERHYPELEIMYVDSLDSLVQKADVLILTTAWQEFLDQKEKIQTKTAVRFSISD